VKRNTYTGSNAPAVVGGQIVWTFDLKNDGQATLQGFTWSDSLSNAGLGPIVCNTTTIAPTQAATCTASYTITQQNCNAGQVVNTATVTATAVGPSATAATLSRTSTSTVALQQAPAVSITKTFANSALTTTPQVNSPVAFTIQIANTGNIDLSSYSITDNKISGLPVCPAIALYSTGGNPGVLSPGRSFSCSYTYNLQQTDVDAGVWVNTATVTTTTINGTSLCTTTTGVSSASVCTSTANVTWPLTGTISMTKIPLYTGSNAAAAVGQAVPYTFMLKNTGATTLRSITVSDVKLTTAPSCSATTLAPGAETNCTSNSYKVTQTDVEAGRIYNEATVSSKIASTSTWANFSTSANVQLVQAPTLDVTATFSAAYGANGVNAGDVVTYTVVVTNTGNMRLYDTALTDKFNVETSKVLSCTAAAPYLRNGAKGYLSPGETFSCQYTHKLVQSDVDATKWTDIASGVAVTVGGVNACNSPTSKCSTTMVDGWVGYSAISLTKYHTYAAGISPATTTGTGKGILYYFNVTNTGYTTVQSVSINDTMISTVISCTTGTLAPAATTQCTTRSVEYMPTQTQINSGFISNTAEASATSTSDNKVVKSTYTDYTSLLQAPQLTVSKVATPNYAKAAPATVNAGDEVKFVVKVINTGNVAVNSIRITDVPASINCVIPTVLNPGASIMCDDYILPVTQTIVDAGNWTNTVTVQGSTPSGQSVCTSATGSVCTATVSDSWQYAGSITLTQTADYPNANKAAAVNDVVTWRFIATNTGLVTLTKLTFTDEMLKRDGITISCDTYELAPSRFATCSAVYKVNQLDIETAAVTNTATATGTVVNTVRTVSSAPSSATVALLRQPRVVITKKHLGVYGDTVDANDRVTFDVSVQNTGNVALTGVVVTDTYNGVQQQQFLCPGVSTLAVNGAVNCTSYSLNLTQSTVDAQTWQNTATVVASSSAGNACVGDSVCSATVGFTWKNTVSFTVVKSHYYAKEVNKDAAALRDTVQYSFNITNRGAATLTVASIEDKLIPAADITCSSISVPPNQSILCTATYTATQADLNNGKIYNEAIVNATTAGSTTVVSVSANNTVPQVQTKSISLIMANNYSKVFAAADGVSSVGQGIGWAYTVKNTGTVSIVSFTFDCPMMDNLKGTYPDAAIKCNDAKLEPGSSTICTSSSIIGQQDLEYGTVLNAATVYGTVYGSDTKVKSADTSSATLARLPRLKITKTFDIDYKLGNFSAHVDKGDHVTFAISVKNTGNVNLYGITVDDHDYSDAVTCPEQDLYADNTKFLAPNATMTCTNTTITLDQDTVDATVLSNTATAYAESVSGTSACLLHSQGDCASTVQYEWEPFGILTITTFGILRNASAVAVAGDEIGYTVRITNNATTSVTDLELTDALLKLQATTILKCAAPLSSVSLQPGESIECVADSAKNVNSFGYKITQDDLDAGLVINKAIINGVTDTPWPPLVLAPAEAQCETRLTAVPAMTLEKTGVWQDSDNSKFATASEPINYKFRVVNTGNVRIHFGSQPVTDANVAVSCGDSVCSAASGDVHKCLDVGAAYECTGLYNIVADPDLVRGYKYNQAIVNGVSPNGTALVPVQGISNITLPQQPSVSVTKTGILNDANSNARADAGEVINYVITIKNTGYSSLKTVTLQDTMSGSQLTAANSLFQSSMSCSSAFTKALTGTTLTLSFSSELAPSASIVCEARYAINNEDISVHFVSNVAKSCGTTVACPGNAGALCKVCSTEASVNTPLDSTGSLQAIITAETVQSGAAVKYTLVVTNNGIVPLYDILINDADWNTYTSKIDTSTFTCTVGASTTPVPHSGLTLYAKANGTYLARTEFFTCTGTIAISQDDIEDIHGAVRNEAVVSAEYYKDATHDSTITATPSVVHPIAITPAVTVTMTTVEAVPSTDNKATDVIKYSYAIQNSGNTILQGFHLTDTVGSTSFQCVSGVTTVTIATAVLLPSSSITCTALYSISLTDIDSCKRDNVANVDTTSKRDGSTVADSSDKLSIPLQGVARLQLLSLSSDFVAGSRAASVPNTVVTFTYEGCNNGTSTATAVTSTIMSPITGTSYPPSCVSRTGSTLAPVASGTVQSTWTSTYKLTQAGTTRY
jgi:uncharacterized repeat protein (TIGR01451 family)